MSEGFNKPQTPVSPNLLVKLQTPRVSEDLLVQFKDVLRSP
ncbi:hypothetical protein [Brunnivagina elsteri]|nr:hypothetical protein [Calothrix elsteri]